MAGKGGRKWAKVRGNPEKAQFSSSLETVRIWRKYHRGYDQTKYLVEQTRRRLKLRPLAARRRASMTKPRTMSRRCSGSTSIRSDDTHFALDRIRKAQGASGGNP